MILPRQRPSLVLLADAGLTLVAATLALRLIPFRRLAARLSAEPTERVCTPADALRIRRAIEAWARRMPWRTLCFEQGLAAHSMLRRRGFASTLYYGAASAGPDLKAHVWVMSGTNNVIGCENKDEFALLARFPSD